jgi:hypothetical protein
VTFTVTPLVSGGYLVEGTDSKGVDGTVVLKSERWDYVQHLRAHEIADADFTAVVEKFFAPLTKAADKAAALVAGPTNKFGSITIGEEVEGVSATTVELDEQGILLNILDQGKTKRLRWVSGTLVAVR